ISSSCAFSSRDPALPAADPALPAAGETAPIRAADAGAARRPAPARSVLTAVTTPMTPAAATIGNSRWRARLRGPPPPAAAGLPAPFLRPTLPAAGSPRGRKTAEVRRRITFPPASTTPGEREEIVRSPARAAGRFRQLGGRA